MHGFESGVPWAVGVGLAALVAAMILHLLSRALTRSRNERQADLDAHVMATLQSADQPTGDLEARLRRAPHAIARRSLVRAIRALGDDALPRITQIYDALGFGEVAARELRAFSWTRRAEAAMEFGALRRADAAADCMRMLRDRRPEMRLAAARALSDMAAPGALRAILEGIPQATRWAISDTVELAHRFGEAGVPELHGTLSESTNRSARLGALEAIGEIQHADSLPILEAHLADKDVDVRAYATRAIGRIGGDAAVPLLVRSLRDSAWEVRAVAARALAPVRDPDALEALQAALADASWWVRLNAAESIAAQEAEGADTLRRTLASQDKFARDIATQMLERLQSREAAP